MHLTLDPAALREFVTAAVRDALAQHGGIADGTAGAGAERVGYPEPEAARLLGVATHTLRDARRRGEISGRRLGRSVVYSRAALLEWLGGDGS